MSWRRITPRKRQILAAIFWRKKHFGECRVYDLLGDIGIAHATLFDHLEHLKNLGLVSFSKNKARNLSHIDHIDLTPKGEKFIEEILAKYEINLSSPVSEIIQKITQKATRKFTQSLEGISESRVTILTSAGITGKLSRVIHELFERNLTEPVATSLAMYSDIDQLLYDLKRSDKELFKTICRGWLNLEIREGRIASVSIPVAIRGSMPVSALRTLLRSTWSWPEIASTRSLQRYEIEASSMGLINIDKNLVSSTKPTTSYLLEWLASKTYSIFENIPSPNPKAALIVYKEVFNFPTEEEILNPELSNVGLEWLDLTRSYLGATDYEYVITKTLNILKEKVGAIITYEDRLIPYGYSRIIKETPDLEKRLKRLLKLAREGDILSEILILVHAHPGITLRELKEKLQKSGYNLQLREVEEILNNLQKMGLVIVAVQPGNITLHYTFLHVPYILPQKTSDSRIDDKSVKDANIVVRNYIVYVLSTVKRIFKDPEQLRNLSNIIKDLTKGKTVGADDLSSKYGQKFAYSFIKFASQLEPIIEIDEDEWVFKLKDKRIGKLVLDVVAYETLTGSEALGEYSDLLTGIISRTLDAKTILKSSQNLQEYLMQDLGIE